MVVAHAVVHITHTVLQLAIALWGRLVMRLPVCLVLSTWRSPNTPVPQDGLDACTMWWQVRPAELHQRLAFIQLVTRWMCCPFVLSPCLQISAVPSGGVRMCVLVAVYRTGSLGGEVLCTFSCISICQQLILSLIWI